jgi:hypothetical protein
MVKTLSEGLFLQRFVETGVFLLQEMPEIRQK